MLQTVVANPDSSVKVAVATVRNKPDFENMVSFALNCIMQALNPNNSRHDENLRYLLQEKFQLNVCQLLAKEREDRQMVGLCLSVALQLIEFDLNTVGTQMLNEGLLRNIKLNLALLANSVESLLQVLGKLRGYTMAKSDIYQIVCGMLASIQLDADDALQACSFLAQYEFVSMDKNSLFGALSTQTYGRVRYAIAELLWRTVSIKKEVSLEEGKRLLKVIDDNFSNQKLSYLAYNIISPFYKYTELQQKVDKSLANSVTYIYIIAEEEVAFAPKITNEKDFLELLSIMAEAGNIDQYLEKLFLPQLPLLKGEQAELRFISTLKQCCLKQPMESVYPLLQGLQSRSKSPLMALQYEYLLKYAKKDHQLGKLPALPTISDKLTNNKKLFRYYFKTVMEATVTFNIKYSFEEALSFAGICMKFISDEETAIAESIYFLERIVQMLFDRLFKEAIYQDLLLRVYEVMIAHKANEKKLHKIEKLMVATFTSGSLAELETVKPERLGLVLPVLLQSPEHFGFAAERLQLLKTQLPKSTWTSISAKFHCMYNLLQSNKYHQNIARVFEAFVGLFVSAMESEYDRNKKHFLEWALYYLKKVKKNAIFLQLQTDEKLCLALDKLLFLMVRSVKMVRCIELYDLLFELESWLDMKSMLRTYQAETAIASALEGHSYSTSDVLELLLVCLYSAPPVYIDNVRNTRILRNLQDNMNRYRPEQLAKVEKVYDYFNKVISINYYREYPQLKQLMPNLYQIRAGSSELNYMLLDHDCSDLNKIIKGSAVVLRGLAGLKHKQVVDDQLSQLFEHEVKLLVGLLLWVNDDGRQLPTDLVEALNSLLTFEFSNSEVIKDILKIIADLPHTFNIAKLPLNHLVVRFIGNLDVLQYLNDLIGIIVESSPQKLADYQLSAVVDKVLCSLVYEQESYLIKEQVAFVENCLKCDKYHDHLATKLIVLHKILEADLTNPALYRPYLVEFALDLLDREDDLKDSPFKLGRLLEKFSDEPEICFLCTTALKDCQPEYLQQSVTASTLINVMMTHEDLEVKSNCQQLLSNFAIDDKYQRQFISSFRKQQYYECYNLIGLVEKPHYLTFDKEDLNRLLAYHAKKQGHSKLKDFLLGNSSLAAALYECDNFYKFELYTEDILAGTIGYDEQLLIAAVEMQDERNIKLVMVKPRFDQKQVASIVKKEQIVQNLAKKLEDKNTANATDKLRLLCMYSQIDELKPIVKASLTPALLSNEAYNCELYNIRLPLMLPDSSRGSVVSAHLISHLLTHIGDYQPTNEGYYQKLRTELLSRKEKEGWFYLKLMEALIISMNNFDSEFLVTFARDILNSLYENFKSIKFNSSKEEQNACTLYLATLLLLCRQAEYSLLNLRKIESLFSQSKLAVDFDMFLTVVEGFINDSKDAYEAKQSIMERLPSLIGIDKECTSVGQAVLQRLSNIKAPPKAAAEVTAQIENMKAEEPKEDFKPLPYEPVKAEPETSGAQEQKSIKEIPTAVRPVPAPKHSKNDGPAESKNSPKQEAYMFELDGKPYFKAPPKSAEKKAELAAKGADNLREYGQLLDQLIDSPDPNAKIAEMENIVGHLFDICDNAFYYRKIVKLNIIEKLILAGTKTNQSYALRLLGKISKCKSKDLLREAHIVEYLKRELKKVLETKQPRSQLSQVTAIMMNCEYEFSKVYFQQGLYSVLVEVAKAKLMQLEVLQFLNSCSPEEKIVNELYQRGLIQEAVVMLKDASSPYLLAEWVKLIGRICINPAIQKKLMDLNVHESIANICTGTSEQKVRSAAALSLGAIAVNNTRMVDWLLSKQIPYTLLKSKLEGKEAAAELCEFLYCISFNNDDAKQAVNKFGGLAFLLKTYKEEASAKFPNTSLFRSCLKALSTICMHKELAEHLIKQRLPEQLVTDLTNHHFSYHFSGMLEAITNITRNVYTPKDYAYLKSQNIWQVLQFLHQGLKGTEDEQNIMITLFNLNRFEQRQMIDTNAFENIFWCITNKNISEEVIHMMVRVFLHACVNSKQPLFSEEIFSSLEKICLKRTSDVYMKELVQILSMTTEQDHVRMMAKYKIADIICDSFDRLIRDKETHKPILETLEVMSRQKEMAQTITTKISSNLIETERYPLTYKIISNLVLDKQNIDVLMQSGLLAAMRTDITASKGTEGKHTLGILKTVLGHCKLSKEDNNALVAALEYYKASTPDQVALLKEIQTLLHRKYSKLSDETKKWMWNGVTAKLYKGDGSVSELQVVITKCLKEINCVEKGYSKAVKPKWRVAINEVAYIVQYPDETSFRKSNFFKSSFMGTVPEKYRCLSIVSSRNELHICFDNKDTKDKWLAGLLAVQQYVTQMLTLLR